MNQNQKSHQPIDKKSTQASANAGHGGKPAAASPKGQAHEHQDGTRAIKPKSESSLVRERESAHKA